MKSKTNKFIFNVLLFCDLSFIAVNSSLLVISTTFRQVFTHTPLLIILNGLFLALALGLSFMQPRIYPDQNIKRHPHRFVVAKQGTTGYNINPQTRIGIGIYSLLLALIIFTIFRIV